MSEAGVPEKLIALEIANVVSKARAYAEMVVAMEPNLPAQPGMEAQVASIQKITAKAREFVEAIEDGRVVCDAWADAQKAARARVEAALKAPS